MELCLNRKDFLDVIELAAELARGKSTSLVYGHALVQASDSQVQLTITDLETTLRTLCPADAATVVKPGNGVLPVRQLRDALKTTSIERITLSAGTERLKVEAGPVKYHLNVLPTEDYPSTPDRDETILFDVDSGALLRAFEAIGHALPPENSSHMPYLAGIGLVKKTDTIQVAATDGRRLALHQVPVSPDAMGPETVFVPSSMATVIPKLLSPTSEAAIAIGEKHLVLSTPRATLITQTIDGSVPDYEAVLPKTEGVTAVVARDQLNASLRRMAVVAEETLYPPLALHASGTVLKLEAGSEGGAWGTETLEIPETLSFSVSVCLRFLAEAVKAFRGSSVSITWYGEGMPIVLRDPDEPLFLAAIMPLQL